MAVASRKMRSKGMPKKRKRVIARSDAVQAALAAFAHEVRTPLTGILAVSDLLATSDLGEQERRWVETIRTGAEHLASLATLFVEAAKCGKARRRLRQEAFDLRAVVRRAGDSLAARAAAKGLRSSVKIAAKTPAFVIGDAVRLRAALENLIDNAVKFTDLGVVSLNVKPAQRASGKLVMAFAVSDSGIGLSPAEIPLLFRPFSQANISIASRFGGAGLGLSFVKQFAREMGGDIAVTPRRGGGATFLLTLSMKRARKPVRSRAGKRANPLHAPVKALRVLCVEDNPYGRVVLNAILTGLGHQAEFTGRGEGAAERVATEHFDAVLMDMALPGIGGVEAIRQIRALPTPHGRIAIAGVSGDGDQETAARSAGASAFLVKPMSPRALSTALLEALRHAEAST